MLLSGAPFLAGGPRGRPGHQLGVPQIATSPSISGRPTRPHQQSPPARALCQNHPLVTEAGCAARPAKRLFREAAVTAAILLRCPNPVPSHIAAARPLPSPITRPTEVTER